MEKSTGLAQRRIWPGPLSVLVVLIIGFALGLVAGWITVEFKPSADDVAAAADSYALNGDANLAKTRLQNLSRAELARILNNLIRERNSNNRTIEAERLNALARALSVTVGPSPGTTPSATDTASRTPQNAGSPPPTLTNLLVPVGLIVIFAAVLIGGGILFVSRIIPEMRSAREAAAPPSPMRMTGSPAATEKMHGVLGQFQASYTLGSDQYDVSFPLESPQQEFLGECGVGVSETIGEGPPEKVTALDLWLFDKADVRTVTQILMSEHAFNNQGLRAKLAKGAAVLAAEDKTLTLETQTLRVQATVVELVYATDPDLPRNSYFEKLSVEIAGFLK